MQDISWQDFLTATGWLVGVFSAYWGVRQRSRANEADRREKETRQLLYKRRGIQLILGLSEATLTLSALIDTGDKISVRRETLKIASDLTRTVSFFGGALENDSAKEELASARSLLGEIVQIVSAETNGALEDKEREAIRRACLEALFNLQSIRGYLEMQEDLTDSSQTKKAW